MFIILTDYSNEEKIYINPLYIKHMETMGDNYFGNSTLVKVDEEVFKVSETPDEIVDMIKQLHKGG